MNLAQIWKATLGELELSISKANFTTWFKHTSIKEFSDGLLVLLVPNEFTKNWLKNKYQKEIFRAINHVSDNQVQRIDYFVGSIEEIQKNLAAAVSEPVPIAPVEQVTQPEEADSPSLRQYQNGHDADSETGLNPRYQFANFIIGAHNELARAACKAVAENPGHDYNPLFIYGGVGLGKTHLIQAAGNRIKDKLAGKKVLYISSDKFTKSFIDSLQSRNTKSFLKSYEDIDALIIDDIQFLAGKTQTQEQFFHIFNSLFQAGRQIILSSDRPPQSIPTLEDRLRSRFAGGMVADIGPPDLETRMAIVRAKAGERGFQITAQITEMIARSESSNIRELEGNLKRVLAHCELKKCELSEALVETVLETQRGMSRQNAITPAQVIDAVGNFYGIDGRALRGNSRKKEIVGPRQIAMFLMREETKSSFPSIGDHLGGRDHTTAMHAYDKVRGDLENNESLRQEIELIRQKLYL